MEKVSDEYVKAVMTAASDKAVAAHELGKGAVADLAEIGKLFPEKVRPGRQDSLAVHRVQR
jgi:hypothetical protein